MSTEETAVSDNESTSCWTVEERAWKQDLPHLSDEVIALLATPVVVHASAFAGRSTQPVVATTTVASVAAGAAVATAPTATLDELADVAVVLSTGDHAPHFLAPAPSRAVRRNAGRNTPRHPARIA